MSYKRGIRRVVPMNYNPKGEDYCCSNQSLVDKIICDLNKAPDLPHLHTFLSNQRHCFHCKDVLGDDEFCQRCTCTRCGSGLSKGLCLICENSLNDSPSISKNSSQSPPRINHNCCYKCGDLLEGIFCRQCTCKLCGNGAHYGYNCSPKVLILPNPEPFNNQTIKELLPTVLSFNSKSDLIHDYPNVFEPPLQLPFISYEFYGNDARYGHYCTPQVPFVYPEPCYNQDVNFLPEFQEFHDFQQHLCCENGRVTHEAYKCQPKNQGYYHEQNSCYDSNSFGFDQFQPQQYTVNHPIFNAENELFDSQNKLMEQLTSTCDMIPACYNDFDDDYAFAITPNKPDYSLSMGDEHLNTGLATELDKSIKSSVENLVLILSESKGESECDSFSDEDVPEKIFLNPMFDEEIIPMKIDQHPHNAEFDLIESLRIHDSSLIILSKIDSLLDEFADELALLKSIPSGIDETDCDFEEEICLIEKLLYDNSSPRPPKEFVFENSDAEIKSFSPSPIPVKDSDSLMEEIDLSFTPDYLVSPCIEDDGYDSERDILILKDFPSNDTLSIPEIESSYFDIPLFSRPPAKPPD
nr:hypothetical protein [Tanacetum cinerariifolium]